MNRFLHRLGARAIGVAGCVRSTARLPFAEPPALAEDAQQVVVPSAVLEGPPVMDSRRERMRDREPRLAMASQAQGTPPTVPPRQVPLAETLEAIAESKRSQEAPRVEAAAQPRRPEGSAAETPLQHTPEPPLPDSAGDHATGPTERDGADSFLAAWRVATPLMPRQQTRRRGVSSAEARARSGQAMQASVADTTEVHVSIGRIEITAMHEAPAPKRQSPRAKPMTLDEYLTRKRGSRP